MRPALIPTTTILAGVHGSYNAVWVKGVYGEDTFYYGRGAGSRPTGVAVASDLMRVAREIRNGSPQRVSPFAHERLGEYKPVPVTVQRRGRRPGNARELRNAVAPSRPLHTCAGQSHRPRGKRPDFSSLECGIAVASQAATASQPRAIRSSVRLVTG